MNVYSEGSIYEAIEALKDLDYWFVAALYLGGSTTDRMMEVAYECGVTGCTSMVVPRDFEEYTSKP